MTAIAPRRRAAEYTLLDTVRALGRFSRFVQLLERAGLDSIVGGAEPMTVFAPSDRALEQLEASSPAMQALFHDPARLEQLLAGHIVTGTYREADLIPFTRLPSLTGAHLHLSLADGEVHVSGVPLLTPDILGTNGVLHELDGVVLPD